MLWECLPGQQCRRASRAQPLPAPHCRARLSLEVELQLPLSQACKLADITIDSLHVTVMWSLMCASLHDHEEDTSVSRHPRPPEAFIKSSAHVPDQQQCWFQHAFSMTETKELYNCDGQPCRCLLLGKSLRPSPNRLLRALMAISWLRKLRSKPCHGCQSCVTLWSKLGLSP